MRKIMPKWLEKCRITKGPHASNSTYGFNGAFNIKVKRNLLHIICSDVYGWDHVSVSLQHRCPVWSEMCAIKDMFFDPDETVIQFHPKSSEYINNHPFCLHLWRKQNQEHELPPSWMIGVSNKQKQSTIRQSNAKAR